METFGACKYQKLMCSRCGRDRPKMESDLGGRDGEKTASIELSANPCSFPVM